MSSIPAPMSLLPKTEQNDVPVVDIDSDEDGGAAVAPAKNDASSHKTPSPQVELVQQETPASGSALSASDGLSRSFWKAGDYVVGPSSKPTPFQGFAHLALQSYIFFNSFKI